MDPIGRGSLIRCGGFQIKIETPIYDTIPEEDYAALVARRREASHGFIVDDDGLGYTDEGAGARVLAVSEEVPDGAGTGRAHEEPLGAGSPRKGGQEEGEEARLRLVLLA